jgi:chromosome segregation ATPase
MEKANNIKNLMNTILPVLTDKIDKHNTELLKIKEELGQAHINYSNLHDEKMILQEEVNFQKKKIKKLTKSIRKCLDCNFYTTCLNCEANHKCSSIVKFR